jgi:hypothetical protein
MAGDPAAARVQLKEGFELTQKQMFAEALLHLEEALRLDPSSAKTLINLADCEEHLARLVAAQKHWVQARDRATEEGSSAIAVEATRRLDELEARMPTLTIRVQRAVPGATVERDGVALGQVSLGMALPVDPGKRTVRVRAPGRADAKYEVMMAEGDHNTVVVAPGAELPASPDAPDAEEVQTPRVWQRPLGYGLAGAGAIGVGTGLFFGLQTKSKNDASNADGHCDATGCDATGKKLRNEAIQDGNASTIACIAGGALLAVGLVLAVTAPSGEARPARVSVAPEVGVGRGVVWLRGQF